jgi:undecaprenyl phosphate-alpha-L-ara4FN deformylase
MNGRIALKVDVDTLRGTLHGVPALLQLLARAGLDATFLFSLGPDNTGRALRRVLRPGFLRKIWRTSVPRNYGLKTLCYGTVLPAPDIGTGARDTMREVRAAGFEVGVHCYDHVLWQDHVRKRDREWTRQQLSLAVESFEHVFDVLPEVHGAAGWQLNEHVPDLEAELGFRYASDTRGSEPFTPFVNGRPVRCVQLPTTLPTFDEILGVDSCSENDLADVLLARSLERAGSFQVFTLHAELEGMRLLPAFERLLRLWVDHGLRPCSMRELYRSLPGTLPIHEVAFMKVAGRSDGLACQGAAI